jgi:hypothetical protein
MIKIYNLLCGQTIQFWYSVWTRHMTQQENYFPNKSSPLTATHILHPSNSCSEQLSKLTTETAFNPVVTFFFMSPLSSQSFSPEGSFHLRNRKKCQLPWSVRCTRWGTDLQASKAVTMCSGRSPTWLSNQACKGLPFSDLHAEADMSPSSCAATWTSNHFRVNSTNHGHQLVTCVTVCRFGALHSSSLHGTF